MRTCTCGVVGVLHSLPYVRLCHTCPARPGLRAQSLDRDNCLLLPATASRIHVLTGPQYGPVLCWVTGKPRPCHALLPAAACYCLLGHR